MGGTAPAVHMRQVWQADTPVDMSAAAVASAAFEAAWLPSLAVVVDMALPFAFPLQRNSNLVGTRVHTIAHMVRDSWEAGSAEWYWYWV